MVSIMGSLMSEALAWPGPLPYEERHVFAVPTHSHEQRFSAALYIGHTRVRILVDMGRARPQRGFRRHQPYLLDPRPFQAIPAVRGLPYVTSRLEMFLKRPVDAPLSSLYIRPSFKQTPITTPFHQADVLFPSSTLGLLSLESQPS